MKPKKIPMRMCVGCRESKPKRELIRVVRAPDGTVSMDPGGKKPGRGAYVCRQESCLMRAIRQKQLERQLEVQLTDDVADIEEHLVRHAVLPQLSVDKASDG